MSSYLWYFHTGEEGLNVGALFFKPPYARVEEIPITLGMLKQYADSGIWSLKYPEHTIPDRRYDIIIGKVIHAMLFATIVALTVAGLIRKMAS